MRKIIILLAPALLLSSPLLCQKTAAGKSLGAPRREVVNFADSVHFLERAFEFGLVAGGMSYVGDVAPTSLQTVESVQPAAGVYLRRHLWPSLALRANLLAGKIQGDDRNFDKPAWRQQRGYGFTSTVGELSLQAEWEIFGRARLRHADTIPYELDNYRQLALVNVFRHTLSPYLFAGGGAMLSNPKTYFNMPYAEAHDRLEDVQADRSACARTSLRWGLTLGGGLQLDLSPRWVLGTELGLRTAFTDYLDGISEAGQPGKRDWYLLGALNLGYRFGVADRDGDGTPDALDKCPKVPGYGHTHGCPDADGDRISDLEDACPHVAGILELGGCPVKDADRDSIPDVDDQCPTVAGLAKFHGCPDGDMDGVEDRYDRCPYTPGKPEFQGCPDTDDDGIEDAVDECPKQSGAWEFYCGCPVRDTDRDSVEDKIDRCPTVAGLPKFDGCPDSDGDGVEDAKDYCLHTPGPEANYGCPVIAKKDQEKLKFAVKAVQFQTGKAVLKKQSFKILGDIAKIMGKYPDYHLAIEGHTDNVGKDARNQTLSEARAKACLNYLVKKGADAERLHDAGFGETRPIAKNKTAAGRAKNRRVEFNLYIPELKAGKKGE